MKIKAIIALVLCLALFAACGSKPGETDQNSPEGSNAEAGSPSDSAAQETEKPAEHPEYALYYDYISSVIIPERGLANIEEFHWTHSYMEDWSYENYSLLQGNGCFGLLAASIYDLDLDGSEDLLCYYLDVLPTGQTFLPILEGHGGESFVLSMELYKLEGENVVLSDSRHCVNMMDTDSWGSINLYLEKLEDGIYVYSTASAIDYTTEGFAPSTVFHVSDGKFVFDYISGIVYGQGALNTNPNIIMGTSNMNPALYTFGQHMSQTLQLRMLFTLEDSNAGSMVYTVSDNTGLRDVLENGVDAAVMPELPQGGLKPEPENIVATKPVAEAIAEHVAAQSGCVFVGSINNEGGGRVSYRYETEDYSFLSVVFDSSSYALVSIRVSNGAYPIDPEWYAMKDAVIDWPELGLDRAELEFMYGSGVSTNAYTNGVDITGANVAIRQISGTDFVIEYKNAEN